MLEGLSRLKLIFIPVVNLLGIINHTRSNGNHVDLMRNAPVEASGKVQFLLGGHRISPKIPWYRGTLGSDIEIEDKALYQEIVEQLMPAPFSLVLDCHSGFGFDDRIWFPYACKSEPMELLGEVFVLSELLDKTYPQFHYLFEPQTQHYMTQGDLWDYLYLMSLKKATAFIPLTLEMGSWRWIKKNPLQLIHSHGLYHPIKPHRTQRILRRHIVFMEFLIRAVRVYKNWLPTPDQRTENYGLGLAKWYD